MTDDQKHTAPGAPSSVSPPVEQPTTPTEQPPAKPDQRGPAIVSATGRAGGPDDARTQNGRWLTTAQGARLRDTDHSLTAGERGPVLLQDHHLREKLTHFDHERIPERVVHARGAAAHGTFRSYGDASKVCQAAFLQPDVETPVFVRFSTVAGSRGSADTVRDVRGFATKFYTSEGNFDLVGNNMPIFFIQDAIKFPDVVHAVKPHPDREIPQAQSAHDTFWDFVSLHTESLNHVMWLMSDRAIPRSFRMMEGFGVHTFRVTAADGQTSLVKFHWKPRAGVHSLVWPEAQLMAGKDPDFNRRDLADAIDDGAFPEWELGLQVMPDTEDQMFQGIDLLDPTKIVPEELAPVRPVGRMTLERNPINYFAETEQVAFHPGHLVRGIDVTDDPLLQGRLFSYLDTQLTRLGGPNFSQIPINRPHAPVNDMLRDGFHQSADPVGVAPYQPNSLDHGCPFMAGPDDRAFIDVPQPVPGAERVRRAPESFSDHTSQARQFWLSMSDVEKDHLASAFGFELSRCYETAIRERMLGVIATVDDDLTGRVAQLLGLPTPASSDLPEVEPSAALSQVGKTWPVEGRVIGIVIDDDARASSAADLIDVIRSEKMRPLVIAPRAGDLASGSEAVSIDRTYDNIASGELDALIVVGHPQSGLKLTQLLHEVFEQAKPVGGDALQQVLDDAGCDDSAAGLVDGDDLSGLVTGISRLVAGHRVWERLDG